MYFSMAYCSHLDLWTGGHIFNAIVSYVLKFSQMPRKLRTKWAEQQLCPFPSSILFFTRVG
jgi:hypothetical protein